jgi:hypothetical protein
MYMEVDGEDVATIRSIATLPSHPTTYVDARHEFALPCGVDVLCRQRQSTDWCFRCTASHNESEIICRKGVERATEKAPTPTTVSQSLYPILHLALP